MVLVTSKVVQANEITGFSIAAYSSYLNWGEPYIRPPEAIIDNNGMGEYEPDTHGYWQNHVAWWTKLGQPLGWVTI
jgi:hypothetical protein